MRWFTQDRVYACLRVLIGRVCMCGGGVAGQLPEIDVPPTMSLALVRQMDENVIAWRS